MGFVATGCQHFQSQITIRLFDRAKSNLWPHPRYKIHPTRPNAPSAISKTPTHAHNQTQISSSKKKHAFNPTATMQALLSRLPCCSHSFSRSLPLAAAAAAGSARHSYRQHARVATFATALTFDKHGDPPAVLQLRQSNLPQELGDTDVHLQILAVRRAGVTQDQNYGDVAHQLNTNPTPSVCFLPRVCPQTNKRPISRPPSTPRTSTQCKASTRCVRPCPRQCLVTKGSQKCCAQVARWVGG